MTSSRIIDYRNAPPPPSDDRPVVPRRRPPIDDAKASPPDIMGATRIWLAIGIAVVMTALVGSALIRALMGSG